MGDGTLAVHTTSIEGLLLVDLQTVDDIGRPMAASVVEADAFLGVVEQGDADLGAIGKAVLGDDGPDERPIAVDGAAINARGEDGGAFALVVEDADVGGERGCGGAGGGGLRPEQG